MIYWQEENVGCNEKGVRSGCIRIVQVMYQCTRTRARAIYRSTSSFTVRVDVDYTRAPHSACTACMLFADDIAPRWDSHEELEAHFESVRQTLENNGSRTKYTGHNILNKTY